MNLRARRVLTLAVGTLLLLFLGLIYAYSVLMAPLKAQFDWSVSGMTLVFAISIVAFTIGNLLAGKIESAVGVRPVYLLGAALLLDGMIDRMEAELGQKTTVVATGGIAPFITPACRHPMTPAGDLILRGLAVLYEQNK